ncbi:MAG TPA: OsmC family protein [Bryobacteraceae bacterium]|nr:OsmC family protein [Bryobacteraceae bacterium]
MKRDYAVVEYAGNDYFLAIPPRGHAIPLDMDGTRSDASSPMELLLVSLGGCTGADVVSILRKKREQVTSYRVEVRGERREEYPKSFRRMEVRHIVTGRGISKEAVEQAIELSSTKYCGVSASLRPTVEIVTSYEIHEEGAQVARAE